MTVSERRMATSERSLTASATIRRESGDAYDREAGQITTSSTIVWSGSCSISPPAGTGTFTGTAGDDRIVEHSELRIPARNHPSSTLAGEPELVAVGDVVDIDGDLTRYVVRSVDRRTSETLRRLRVVSFDDAEQVPR